LDLKILLKLIAKIIIKRKNPPLLALLFDLLLQFTASILERIKKYRGIVFRIKIYSTFAVRNLVL
jgi:hypothetical protein